MHNFIKIGKHLENKTCECLSYLDIFIEADRKNDLEEPYLPGKYPPPFKFFIEFLSSKKVLCPPRRV